MPRPEEGHLAEEVSGRVPAAVLELLAAGRPMAEIADLEIGQSTIYKTRGKPSFAATVSGPGPTVDRD